MLYVREALTCLACLALEPRAVKTESQPRATEHPVDRESCFIDLHHRGASYVRRFWPCARGEGRGG